MTLPGLLSRLKAAVKAIVPKPILRWRSRRLAAKFLAARQRALDAEFAGMPARAVFSTVYASHAWGGGGSGDFYSGSGSHSPEIVHRYIEAVGCFLAAMPDKLDVVDLGCGDFHVGRQLRSQCARYVACDVVPELIKRNQDIFSGLGVEFVVLDMAEDPLPDGEVVFIRQVLQHLDNARISRLVKKLPQYKLLVLTEHLPATETFRPNVDKQVGAGTRLALSSGVLLTAPPFNLQVKSQHVICEVPEGPGVIRTIAMQLC